jgi:excinuclease ABC subunit C
VLSDFPPQVQKKVNHLPEDPGVYFMKNHQGEIIYIGKAKNLKNRVRSYFSESGDSRRFVRHLKEVLADIEFLITTTEKEALIAESYWIKKHQPCYNVSLKEDEPYTCLRVDPLAPYPRYTLAQRYRQEEALYFGPFPSRSAFKQTKSLMEKLFPLRTCTDAEFQSRTRPCMDYEIGKCCAPCVDYVTREEYQAIFQRSLRFLEGDAEPVYELLTEKMQTHAEALRFEEAGRLRDQIAAVRKTLERKTFTRVDTIEQDVLGIHASEAFTVFKILNIRKGHILHSESVTIRGFLPDPLSSFIRQYYQRKYIPDRILLPDALEDQNALEEVLSEKKQAKMCFFIPQTGEGKKLIDMANRNAEIDFQYSEEQEKQQQTLLEKLQRLLQLQNLPLRIECFDNSNLQGEYAVGAMISFVHTRPFKKGYRRFRIKTVHQADDFATMAEVLTRRYGKIQNPQDFPDLVILDGGKGQLQAAIEVFRKLAIPPSVDLIALAKARTKQEGSGGAGSSVVRTKERIFKPERDEPFVLDPHSPENLLLCAIRDEAHRFAITYHRQVRKQETLRGGLEDIPGIGKKRQEQLLKHFHSVKELRNASLEEITYVPGFSLTLAETIYHALHPKSPTDTG